MVKTLHTLTIRKYSLFEKTGKVKYLLVIPVSLLGVLFKKRLLLLAESITLGLQGESESNTLLEKERHRQISYERIKYLQTLYEAMHNLLVNRVEIDEWLETIGKPKGRRSPYMMSYQTAIKEATGLIVNSVDDLIKLQRVIDRWVEKYHEYFLMKQHKKGLTFMQMVMGIFAAMDMRLEFELSMSDFFDLKEQAEERARKTKTDVG